MPTPAPHPFHTRLVPVTPAQVRDALATVHSIVTGTGELTLDATGVGEHSADATVHHPLVVPAEVRMGLRRVPGSIEITPWSEATSELLLRPAWRKLTVPTARLIDRYYATAHEAMDQLVGVVTVHQHRAA